MWLSGSDFFYLSLFPSIIQTLSWKERQVKKVTTAQPHVINEVLLRLLPLIGADELFN